VSGRLFEHSDFENGAVTVIDERLAQLYFPGEDPVGKRVTTFFSNDPFTIIGVVRHTAARSLSDGDPPPEMYMPLLLTPADDAPPVGRNTTYVVRTTTPPLDITVLIRRAIEQMSPNVAMARIGTLEQTLQTARAPAAFIMTLLVIAGVVGLVLAVIGIYGGITYTVAQRTAEIGVRVAMGARPRDVISMVLQQGGSAAIIGVFAGIMGALAASRLMGALLFGVSPTDPLIYAIVTSGLFAIALFACWVPARRAARLDPLQALRAE
jgi:predicted lysophospholipase L1 biosynthesis ABC-type transport system permease subunit